MNSYTALAVERLPWPLPAMLAWTFAWATYWLCRFSGAAPLVAFGLAIAVPSVMAALVRTQLRRLVILFGFPVSLFAHETTDPLSAWFWLIPLGLLLSIYPLKAWRDAPVFPTASDDLVGLAGKLPLSDGARVLDAGCGLGHGLRAIRREWPCARLAGVERSWPLAWITRLFHPFADVRHGDMWARPWDDFDVVYLFQRPESMPRAWRKACSEMRPGSRLVSLEFAIDGVRPDLAVKTPRRRSLFVYRVPPLPAPAPVHSRQRRVDNADEHVTAGGCLI